MSKINNLVKNETSPIVEATESRLIWFFSFNEINHRVGRLCSNSELSYFNTLTHLNTTELV